MTGSFHHLSLAAQWTCIDPPTNTTESAAEQWIQCDIGNQVFKAGFLTFLIRKVCLFASHKCVRQSERSCLALPWLLALAKHMPMLCKHRALPPKRILFILFNATL